jgi:hypothetical protein
MNINAQVKEIQQCGHALFVQNGKIVIESVGGLPNKYLKFIKANKPAIINLIKSEPERQKAERDLLALADEMVADGHDMDWQKLHGLIADMTTTELHISIVLYNITYRTDIDGATIEQGALTDSQWSAITAILEDLDTKGMGYAVPAFNNWLNNFY